MVYIKLNLWCDKSLQQKAEKINEKPIEIKKTKIINETRIKPSKGKKYVFCFGKHSVKNPLFK